MLKIRSSQCHLWVFNWAIAILLAFVRLPFVVGIGIRTKESIENYDVNEFV